MTSSPSRVLSVGLVVLLAGIIAACAHGGTAPPPSPSTVTEEEIERAPVVSLEQLLAGRVSGVIVTAAPGGGISVRIGGPTSFRLNQEPLYVVDGVAIEAGPNGTLSWLNPHDVASINVLKFAGETAMYGLRGTNGVIIIKTKGAQE